MLTNFSKNAKQEMSRISVLWKFHCSSGKKDGRTEGND